MIPVTQFAVDLRRIPSNVCNELFFFLSGIGIEIRRCYSARVVSPYGFVAKFEPFSRHRPYEYSDWPITRNGICLLCSRAVFHLYIGAWWGWTFTAFALLTFNIVLIAPKSGQLWLTNRLNYVSFHTCPRDLAVKSQLLCGSIISETSVVHIKPNTKKPVTVISTNVYDVAYNPLDIWPYYANVNVIAIPTLTKLPPISDVRRTAGVPSWSSSVFGVSVSPAGLHRAFWRHCNLRRTWDVARMNPARVDRLSVAKARRQHIAGNMPRTAWSPSITAVVRMMPVLNNLSITSKAARRRCAVVNTLRTAWWMFEASVAFLIRAIRRRASTL